MEQRWDNKYPAKTPFSFSTVALRDVLELAVIIAEQTSVCVCLHLLLATYFTNGVEGAPHHAGGEQDT